MFQTGLFGAFHNSPSLVLLSSQLVWNKRFWNKIQNEHIYKNELSWWGETLNTLSLRPVQEKAEGEPKVKKGKTLPDDDDDEDNEEGVDESLEEVRE